MINRIKEVLKRFSIEKWRITEENRSAQEVYYIGSKLDMNRSKEVHVYKVTVYVDFDIEGQHYTGDSTTTVDASMDAEALSEIIADTKLAAGFVKNKAYDLYRPSSKLNKEDMKFIFDEKELVMFMPSLVKSIYEQKVEGKGGINSSEIMINRYDRRIMTSAGVDVQVRSYNNLVEVVTEWDGMSESVELMFDNNYGDFNPEALREDVQHLLENTKDRASAKPMFEIKDVPVIITGDYVKDIFSCYITKANAKMKYEGLSTYEIGKSVQGEGVQGDLVNIDLVPILKGSTLSRYFDREGFPLEACKLIEDGVLKRYIASTRYASYLGVEPTGGIGNYAVKLGETDESEMKKAPYVEIISFSDLNVNGISGDIGGEIRLAKYFDGKETYKLTGGSISTNIAVIEKTMKLSNESRQVNNFIGPKVIQFTGVDILA